MNESKTCSISEIWDTRRVMGNGGNIIDQGQLLILTTIEGNAHIVVQDPLLQLRYVLFCCWVRQLWWGRWCWCSLGTGALHWSPSSAWATIDTDIVCTGDNAGEALVNDAQVDGQQQSVDPLGNVAELLADHGYPILANTSWTLQCQCWHLTVALDSAGPTCKTGHMPCERAPGVCKKLAKWVSPEHLLQLLPHALHLSFLTSRLGLLPWPWRPQ